MSRVSLILNWGESRCPAAVKGECTLQLETLLLKVWISYRRRFRGYHSENTPVCDPRRLWPWFWPVASDHPAVYFKRGELMLEVDGRAISIYFTRLWGLGIVCIAWNGVAFPFEWTEQRTPQFFFADRLLSYGHLLEIQEVRSKYRGVFKLLILEWEFLAHLCDWV